MKQSTQKEADVWCMNKVPIKKDMNVDHVWKNTEWWLKERVTGWEL